MQYSKAKEIVGSDLGNPSKMPGRSLGISAYACKVGRKLATIKGSVCEKCYATRGNYTFPVAKNAHARRMEGISHPLWIEAMVTLLEYHAENYFRWHDSGDIQSLGHLEKISQIAKLLPDVHFWLPTKEKGTVQKYLRKHRRFPKNLVVRYSAPMRGEVAKRFSAAVSYSSVSSGKGYACPAKTQEGRCGPCRACWKKDVKNIDYTYH